MLHCSRFVLICDIELELKEPLDSYICIVFFELKFGVSEFSIGDFSVFSSAHCVRNATFLMEMEIFFKLILASFHIFARQTGYVRASKPSTINTQCIPSPFHTRLMHNVNESDKTTNIQFCVFAYSSFVMMLCCRMQTPQSTTRH